MAQLMWYIARTKDTGKVTKLVEATYVRRGHYYHEEPLVDMRRRVEEESGLELVASDGPYWIPLTGYYAVVLAASLLPPKWRKSRNDTAPLGIDEGLWNERRFTLGEIAQWRRGYLWARAESVWVYVDMSKKVGDQEFVTVFADEKAANDWASHDPGGVVTEHPLIGAA